MTERSRIPAKGEVQRPRNGRAERGHVHRSARLLEALLGRHAEALLLVHHHEAEVLEGDVLAEQPVRAA
ncbi:MAG: hypothetical protein U0838_10250 [Chloroflexota bacterium]